jgi:hypothetical protein
LAGQSLFQDSVQIIPSYGVLSRAGVRTITSCTEIQLRIRTKEDTKQFVHINYIVQTLLHELAHIAPTSDHDLSFWWRNAQLFKELERDVSMRVVDVKWREVPPQVTHSEEVSGLNWLLLAITLGRKHP